MVAIRPEQISIRDFLPDGKTNVLPVILEGIHFLGDRYEYTVSVGSETRVLLSPAAQALKAGQKVFLELKPEGITQWPKQA